MKYFIVAGEPSGDLHGSNLMKQLKKMDENAEFVFLGGDLMQKEGGQLLIHYRQMAFMGGLQILGNLRTILGNIKKCKQQIIENKPDVVVLIDYAGFNLKIAKFAKAKGFKVFFYISPKVWAWREGRVKQIKRYVDKMFVILPFETEFYKKHDYDVEYVGNPLLDSIRSFNRDYDITYFTQKNDIPEKYVALLAGSRKQEVDLLLPEMIKCAKNFPDEFFVLATAPSLTKSYYSKFTFPENLKPVYDKTYYVLKHAHAAIVTSGTATLETGLFEVPQVVVYKTNAIQYYVGRMLVDIKKLKYFSLVNLILGREAVKEILQFNVAKQVIEEMEKILYDENHYQRIKADYRELLEKVGYYKPSEKLAEKIVVLLKNHS